MAAKKKLEDAKAGGATTRPYEDKVYEIEDELRLGFETGALKPLAIEIVPFEKAVDAYCRVAAREAKAKQVLSFDGKSNEGSWK